MDVSGLTCMTLEARASDHGLFATAAWSYVFFHFYGINSQIGGSFSNDNLGWGDLAPWPLHHGFNLLVGAISAEQRCMEQFSAALIAGKLRAELLMLHESD